MKGLIYQKSIELRFKKNQRFSRRWKVTTIQKNKKRPFFGSNVVVSVFGGGKEKERERKRTMYFLDKERIWESN